MINLNDPIPPNPYEDLYTIASNSCLVITGDRNASTRNDFTRAFDPEAKAFMKLYNIPSDRRLKVNLGNAGFESPKRRKEVLDFITSHSMVSSSVQNKVSHLQTLAFFCHGLNLKLEVGFGKKHIPELVQAILRVQPAKNLLVLLYCCSTGDDGDKDTNDNGDGSFADALRDELCKNGLVNCRVVAHTVSGHATYNPMKRFFDGLGSPVGGMGGQMIVSSVSNKSLFAKWRIALKDNKSLFRFRCVTMSIAEIHKTLISV